MDRRRQSVTLAASLEDWAPITVHLTGRISRRDRIQPYKGRMFAAYPGDIVFSKIDARNGAIGVLPPEIGKAVVTAEYPVFTTDATRLEGQFVKLVIRTGGFIEALRRKATGTSGRKRITPAAFEDLRIPLPPLHEQRTIVAVYGAAVERAEAMETAADEAEAQALAAFDAELGFEQPPPLPDRPVFVASFENLDRWSHEAVLRSTLHLNDGTLRFSAVELGTVGKVSYGIQKSPSNRPAANPRPYLRVANVQRWYLDLNEIKMIDVPEQNMPAYRLEDGDVLLCEGNSADLVGRGAIWRNEIANCVHQNHVLRARMDTSRAVPEFVLAVINSAYGQAYFRSKAKRTTNLASINSIEVSRFPLPLPSLEKQRVLVNALFHGRKKAEELRKQASINRTTAWANFEAAVYAERR